MISPRGKWIYSGVWLLMAMAVAIGVGLRHIRELLLGHYSSPLSGGVRSSVATAVQSFPAADKRSNTVAANAGDIVELESRLATLHWEKIELQRDLQNIPGMSSWQKREAEGDSIKSKLRFKDEEIKEVETQLLALRLTDGRLINDPTLPWNATMYRPWLDLDLSPAEQPRAMILLTNRGWNHPNISQGMTFPRHQYETALYSALVNHPWFHPTAFADIESGKLQIRTRGVRYYVFADLHHKDFANWPVYAGQATNLDASFNRTVARRGSLIGDCGVDRAGILQSKLFSVLNATTPSGEDASSAVLFLLSQAGHALQNREHSPKNPYVPKWISCTEAMKDKPIAVAALDSHFSLINERRDQGLLPPPIKMSSLNAEEQHDIQSCSAESKRRFHVSYIGNFRSGPKFFESGRGARAAYKPLHNNRTIIVLRYFNEQEMKNSIVANMSYDKLLRSSEFALAPRGDNKFSFRFSEVLSAGAIPVVHADDWVWPFRPEVVDWNRCAVILPEKLAGNVTLDRIAKMTTEERCLRTTYCYFHIYNKYVGTFEGQLQGYLDGLESIGRSNNTTPFAGFRCNASSIARRDCNPY